MGLFDLFGRNNKTTNQTTREGVGLGFSEPTTNETVRRSPVSVFSPTSYDDVQIIIDTIKAGKSAIVHFKQLKPETAIRVLDMLSGAIYALEGGVYEMEKNIFMFSPDGVEMA